MTVPAAWETATVVLGLVVSAWVVGILYGVYLSARATGRGYLEMMGVST